mmetsp:Transcript_15548/g.26405  ORF Transcript_15548/g.26405 Transcript_15548/m.26405 type:complete len:170 (+) Transcript_15548:162-671(+)
MKIVINREIAISAPELWEVFGSGFGDWYEWADGLVKSSMDGGAEVTKGAIRNCDLKAFGPVAPGKIQEEVIQFEPEKMELTYLVLNGMPGFMRRVVNAWVITPIDDSRCRITSTAEFTLAWYIVPMYPVMWCQLRGGLVQFQSQLENFALKKSPLAAAKTGVEVHADSN